MMKKFNLSVQPYVQWNVNIIDTQSPSCCGTSMSPNIRVLVSITVVSFELVHNVRHSHSLTHILKFD